VDEEEIRRSLATALEQLAAHRRLSTPSDRTQVRALFEFEDSLAAAAYARALGETEEARMLLSQAAAAGAEIFRLRGTVVSRIGYLPSGREESFIDLTPTNAWNYVRALYAGLASGATEPTLELARMSPDAYRSDQVKTSAAVDRYAASLARVVAAGRDVQRAEELADLAAEYESSPGPDDRYWAAQARALATLLTCNDESVRRDALAKLTTTLQEQNAELDELDPERLLELPLLGLGGLAS
jgi:hypothetical protein